MTVTGASGSRLFSSPTACLTHVWAPLPNGTQEISTGGTVEPAGLTSAKYIYPRRLLIALHANRISSSLTGIPRRGTAAAQNLLTGAPARHNVPVFVCANVLDGIGPCRRHDLRPPRQRTPDCLGAHHHQNRDSQAVAR
jgi:hypothetical protein